MFLFDIKLIYFTHQTRTKFVTCGNVASPWRENHVPLVGVVVLQRLKASEPEHGGGCRGEAEDHWDDHQCTEPRYVSCSVIIYVFLSALSILFKFCYRYCSCAFLKEFVIRNLPLKVSVYFVNNCFEWCFLSI